MIEHPVVVSPAQIKKLVKGGAITLKPSSFVKGAKHMLMLRPNTSRRISTAVRKNKGVRVMLKPDEDIMEENEIEGGKISLKSIGRTLKRTFASRKAINTYKAIGREALPIVKGVADAGIDAGSMALATYMGNPALAPVISGTAKVGLDRGYSALGRQVGLDPNTPVPSIQSPEQLEALIRGKAEENLMKRTKGRVRQAGLAALSGDLEAAKSIASDYAIDKKMKGVEQKIARKAKAGQYASIQDLANDYAAEKLASAANVVPDMGSAAEHQDELDALKAGRGIRVRKTRKGLKIGGASAYLSPAYEGAKYGGATGLQTGLRSVSAPAAPSSIIQTGSPYQTINSAAMSPFVGSSPQLANKPIGGSGMYPAGRYGNGFVPAG